METVKSTKDLLAKPLRWLPLKERSDVPLLSTTYTVYRTALFVLVGDWLDGKVGTGAPSDKWEQDLIRDVNDSVNRTVTDTASGEYDELDDETKRVYDALVAVKVQNHLKMATSHRRWIRRSHAFCEKIGVKFSEPMSELIRIHDLSKYTHMDVLGYAVMFGDEQIEWKQLEQADEKYEWENTLTNHYARNPHHPEYFYPKLSDGTRDKSKTIMELDSENGKTYLEESVIDMLAARGERILKHDSVISVEKWMDIQERYCGRYAPADKAFVLDKLAGWKSMAVDFLEDKSHAESMNGHFDKRPVVTSGNLSSE